MRVNKVETLALALARSSWALGFLAHVPLHGFSWKWRDLQFLETLCQVRSHPRLMELQVRWVITPANPFAHHLRVRDGEKATVVGVRLPLCDCGLRLNLAKELVAAALNLFIVRGVWKAVKNPDLPLALGNTNPVIATNKEDLR